LKSIYILKKNYRINSKKVTREMWLQNIISLTKLKENPTKTYKFIVYDLDKVKFLEFYAETNYTLKNGIYKEYYTNGKIKQIGYYDIYMIRLEPNDIEWKSSLKNGKWLTYKKDGRLESEQNFNRGVSYE
jgi:antitoxin component YwqK of YwqJK toxin-antitoxin module